MTDTSTFTGLHGEMVDQVMGSSEGYDEYLAGYELATNKAAYKAQLLERLWHENKNRTDIV